MTKEESLIEQLKIVLEKYSKLAITENKIARDHAVKVAELLNCKDEKGIERRKSAYMSFNSYKARESVYRDIEHTLKEILRKK